MLLIVVRLAGQVGAGNTTLYRDEHFPRPQVTVAIWNLPDCLKACRTREPTEDLPADFLIWGTIKSLLETGYDTIAETWLLRFYIYAIVNLS